MAREVKRSFEVAGEGVGVEGPGTGARAGGGGEGGLEGRDGVCGGGLGMLVQPAGDRPGDGGGRDGGAGEAGHGVAGAGGARGGRGEIDVGAGAGAGPDGGAVGGGAGDGEDAVVGGRIVGVGGGPSVARGGDQHEAVVRGAAQGGRHEVAGGVGAPAHVDDAGAGFLGVGEGLQEGEIAGGTVGVEGADGDDGQGGTGALPPVGGGGAGGEESHLGTVADGVGDGGVGRDGVPGGAGVTGGGGGGVEAAVEDGDGNGAVGRRGDGGQGCGGGGRGAGREADGVIQLGVRDDGGAAELREEGFDVGAGREADEVDAVLGFDEHPAGLVEEGAELFVGGAGADGDEQFVAHELGAAAGDAARDVEGGAGRGVASDGAAGAAGREDADAAQLGDFPERAGEEAPGEEVVVAAEHRVEAVGQFFAAERARERAVDTGIGPDFDARARELVEDRGQRRALGLQPDAVAVETEVEGPRGDGEHDGGRHTHRQRQTRQQAAETAADRKQRGWRRWRHGGAGASRTAGAGSAGTAGFEGGDGLVGDVEAAHAGTHFDAGGGLAVEVAAAGRDQVEAGGQFEVVAREVGGMLGVVAFHADQAALLEGAQERFHALLAEVQREGMREHRHPSRRTQQVDGHLGGQARAVGVRGLAVAEPVVEGIVLVLDIALLDHHLREVRAADDVLAGLRPDLLLGDREAEFVELAQDFAVAGGAAVADPFELAVEFGVGGVHPVAEHVHDAGGAVDADLDSRHRAERVGCGGGLEAGQPGEGIMVGQREGGQTDGVGLVGQLLGGEGAVGKGGMAVEIDHGEVSFRPPMVGRGPGKRKRKVRPAAPAGFPMVGKMFSNGWKIRRRRTRIRPRTGAERGRTVAWMGSGLSRSSSGSRP